MRALSAVALCAACSQHGGLDITVEAPTGSTIDRISLFVGIGDATTPTLYPPEYTRNGIPLAMGVAGKVWSLDQTDFVDTTDHIPATFSYAPGELSASAVIAVGFANNLPVATASDVITDPIPTKYLEERTLTLVPADDPVMGTMPARVQVWTAMDAAPLPHPVCVHAEDRLTNTVRSIVSANDLDCDGYPNDDPLECRNDVYMAARAPTIDETRCVAHDNFGGTTTSWVLGGPGCIDGMSRMPLECKESAYCLPGSVAAYCANAPDRYLCAANVDNPLWFSSVPPSRVSCNFYATRDTSGNITLCTPTAQPSADWLPAEWSLAGCDFAKLRDDLTSWDTRLEYPAIRYQLGQVNSDCTFVITADNLSSTEIGPMASLITHTGMLALSAPGKHGLAVPIELNLSITNQTCAPGTVVGSCYAAIGSNAPDALAPCMLAPLQPGQIAQ